MTDQDVRDFLERMATEEPVQVLDAEPLTRRARRRAARTVVVGAVGVAAAVAVLFAGVAQIQTAPVPVDDPTPTPVPSQDLGIFAPVAGRIVYGDSDGIWGVDPTAPEAPAVQLTTEAGTPLGWSSDGTRLLIMRDLRQGDLEGEMHLVVLHADGSETLVAENQGWIPGAAISPDGSHVVFTSYDALYSVDAEGGSVEVLFRGGEDEMGPPTFSPDGSEIAFTVGGGDHSHRVWMMNADGSDPHEIVANETTMGAGHVNRLAWSLARDRIALGFDQGTYTFAPDGSGFTQVLTAGTEPYWSPDGSRLAYTVCLEGPPSCRLGIADADGSNARTYDVATSGPWHPGVPAVDEPGPTPSGATPTPTEPLSDEPPVLQLQTWAQGYVELAVYADGRVIWADGVDNFSQMRLTPEGVESLRARAVSTGLFEHDLALGLDLRWGAMEVRRGDRSVTVAWGEPGGVSGVGLEGERFVDATPAQTDELAGLEAFLDDPIAWALPPDMYVQAEPSSFVPTHLWVSWDRNTPDPSKLPSPAREVLTRNLEARLDGRCETISIAQAQEIALAMEQAGLIEPDDVLDGIEFTMPGLDGGGSSFLHAHPSLPHESSCD